MASSCELLDAELALDRVEAALARDLAPHLRAYAEAYAAQRTEPAAPEILARTSTIETARRALAHPILAERGLALLRLAVPIALHVPGCGDYPAMIAQRDAIAQRLFGTGALELVHRLHGARGGHVDEQVPGPVLGWREPDGHPLDPARAWRALAGRHGVAAEVRFLASAARARTFVVAPREHVVVVPPRIETPAARFALMHELGHVLAACLSPAGIPRALDEAIAAVTAITDEPIAVAGRARRLALARHLDGVERGLAPLPADIPWALWHDPGAQAAYVEAERLADVLAGACDLRGVIATARDAIDRTTSLRA